MLMIKSSDIVTLLISATEKRWTYSWASPDMSKLMGLVEDIMGLFEHLWVLTAYAFRRV